MAAQLADPRRTGGRFLEQLLPHEKGARGVAGLRQRDAAVEPCHGRPGIDRKGSGERPPCGRRHHAVVRQHDVFPMARQKLRIARIENRRLRHGERGIAVPSGEPMGIGEQHPGFGVRRIVGQTGPGALHQTCKFGVA